MTYRDILVHIDDTPASETRAAAAAELALRSNAHLGGVFLKSEFLRNYMAGEALAYMSPSDTASILKDHASAILQASERGREIFESAAGRAGASSEWMVIDGDFTAPMSACARRFDLTIFPTIACAALGQHTISAADLGLSSGGPVLVSPEHGLMRNLGKRVLIAWKGTRESARALRDAWPLIMGAEQVHILVVSPHGEGGPDGLLQRHFERHGRDAKLIVDRSSDASAAAVLRAQVKALDIDLVVMGLYGRSRIQERVLGGVSHDLVSDPPSALLISH
ncbi:universal stress protein [Phenylobacterium sp.]|uniref:universal stress protein n=1 Tax=Phenylobacterium sp. TaxID=1871053 RepID=UPI0030F3AE9F